MNSRLLNPSDAKRIWELRAEALQQNPEAFATSYEEFIQRDNPLERIKENLTTQGNFTFGAFENEELVGVVSLLQENALKIRHRANIYAMYVTPKMRGCGIGKALLLEAIKKASAIPGIEKLNLSVVSTNEKAKKLYITLGFEVFGKEEKALKINETYYDEDHMVLFLPG
jgi:RimJ/RimL family protein N-acetyltransferase